MDINISLGICLILFAYISIWFLLIKSIKIIEYIDKKELSSLKDIKDESVFNGGVRGE